MLRVFYTVPGVCKAVPPPSAVHAARHTIPAHPGIFVHCSCTVGTRGFLPDHPQEAFCRRPGPWHTGSAYDL